MAVNQSIYIKYFFAVPILQCLFGALLHRLLYPGHGQTKNGEFVPVNDHTMSSSHF